MPYPYSNDLGKKPPPSSKAERAQKDAVLKKISGKMAEEQKAQLQAALMRKMFGDKPEAIKFPGIVPKVFTPDFTNPALGKWGKADLSKIPDEGPPKLYLNDEALDKLTELVKNMTINVEDLEAQLSDEPVFKKPPGSFSKVDANQPDAYVVNMKFQVDGIEGLDGTTLYASQTVNKAFMYGSPKAASVIVDDMLRQVKELILKKMKGE